MKPYSVDVPVRVNIWIRPECQAKQWEVIKKARPSILFLQSDGGRNDEEWEAIKKNRRMIDEGIDWECTVYRLYEEKNNGLYTMSRKTQSLIWSTVDRCMFLEDDHVPSVSFFRYCAELLEKYKDDMRIQGICGMNHLGISENVTADYFFSRQGGIWGTATWVSRYKERGDFSYANDPYIMNLLKNKTANQKAIWKRIEAYGKQEKYEGHVAGGEFWTDLGIYSQNRLLVIPKRNMIKNIGYGEKSEHFKSYNSKKAKKTVFDMETYELEFPMIHPKYVIADDEYEKKRDAVLGYNKKFPRLRTLFGNLLTLNFSYFINRIKRFFTKSDGQRDEK